VAEKPLIGERAGRLVGHHGLVRPDQPFESCGQLERPEGGAAPRPAVPRPRSDRALRPKAMPRRRVRHRPMVGAAVAAPGRLSSGRPLRTAENSATSSTLRAIRRPCRGYRPAAWRRRAVSCQNSA
jgi:hypothetical protein